MIPSLDAARLTPTQRANLIEAAAHAQMSDHLWQATLGASPSTADSMPPESTANTPDRLDLTQLLALFDARRGGAARPSPLEALDALASDPATCPPGGDATTRALGPNAVHAATLQAAADRSGIPGSALAAIVQAEAAKDSGGRWNCYSRNPRSSAAGLGQFLGGTWQSLAEKPGSWLNGVAQARGWLNSSGRVRAESKAAVLALRYDPTAAIQSIADYARSNLDTLRRAGVAVGTDPAAVARSAYLGHHLGPGDMVRFFKGGLDDGRARTLLAAQIGHSGAGRAIAASGDARAAHRAWLTAYVARNVQPQRFA